MEGRKDILLSTRLVPLMSVLKCFLALCKGPLFTVSLSSLRPVTSLTRSSSSMEPMRGECSGSIRSLISLASVRPRLSLAVSRLRDLSKTSKAPEESLGLRRSSTGGVTPAGAPDGAPSECIDSDSLSSWIPLLLFIEIIKRKKRKKKKIRITSQQRKDETVGADVYSSELSCSARSLLSSSSCDDPLERNASSVLCAEWASPFSL